MIYTNNKLKNTGFRCRVPECDGTNASSEIPPWWPKNVDSKCFRPVVDVSSFGKSNDTCSNATFEETLEECHEWIYENHNSIVAAVSLIFCNSKN